MSKYLMGTVAGLALTLGAMAAGGANAQDYDGGGPRPPYATGAYVGLGIGSPDCSFTLVGAHAGVTVLGINAGAGARIGLPGGCREEGPAPVAYQPQYAPPPQPYYGGQGYGGGYQGGYYNQGYAAPVAYPQPAYPQPAYPQPGYGGYGQPCGCQPVAYQPY